LTRDQESKAIAALNEAAPQLYAGVRPTRTPEASSNRPVPQNGTALESKPETKKASKPTRAEQPSNGSAKAPAVPTTDSGRARTKADRLAELLQAYKADKITPFEYHSERAKILAEP
jgi:hypothetical protein